MKREVLICDICKKSMAQTKCDFCGCDLCNGARCRTENRLDFNSLKQNSRRIAMFTFCSKCNKFMTWQGDLSPDIKEIIIDRIKARKMLNVVEKDNG